MLIELWENLRGYDQWTPAEATLQSSDFNDVEEFRGFTQSIVDGRAKSVTTTDSQATSVITWSDEAGNEYRSRYTVTQPSALFGLYGGEKLAIRYNPANPQEFYLRELSRNQFDGVVRTIGWVILLIVGSALSIWRYGKFLHIQ